MNASSPAPESYDNVAVEGARSLVPDVDLEAMSLGLTLIRAANRIQQDLENNVHRPAGVTWAGFRVLFSIAVCGSLLPRDVARLSNVSPPSATSVLNTLEKYGWIRRDPSEKDGRAKVCALTPRGLEVVRDLLGRNNRRESQWRTALTGEELRSTVANLQKLLAHHPGEPDPIPAESPRKLR